MTRVVDEKATKIARARQQRGIDLLQAMFGWDPRGAAAHAADRRRAQGSGPSYPGWRTRKQWTRPARRKATKAQRIARRRNRS